MLLLLLGFYLDLYLYYEHQYLDHEHLNNEHQILTPYHDLHLSLLLLLGQQNIIYKEHQTLHNNHLYVELGLDLLLHLDHEGTDMDNLGLSLKPLGLLLRLGLDL